MMLAEEQKERIDEKAELRRALETAGVQVLTTEERAKERLEAIRARRAEIAEADQKTRALEGLDGEDEILAADELELGAYLDAAVTMAKSEPPADGADPQIAKATRKPQTIQTTRKTRRKKTRKTELYLS